MRTIPLALLAMVCLGSPVASQTTIARDRYLELLPEMPKIVSQTRATDRFQLFGNRSLATYQDVNNDGIDDARGEWLRQLATRFAPILRRNNFSAPRDFQLATGGELYVQRDVWRDGKRVRSDSMLLGAPGRPPYQLKASGEEELVGSDANDRSLLSLLQAFSPRERDSRSTAPEEDSKVVLFIDFPGSDEGSWRHAYLYEHDLASYVHPFIDELPDSTDARFALALQFWFFYPFNDGANNHEGDWEHMNITLTLRSKAAATLREARLTEVELRAVIENGLADTELDIASVEYYFHETFTVLDYVAARNPQRQGSGRLGNRLRIWSDPNYIDNLIRERTSDARLASHPVGYIGGNNRGPDEFGAFWPRFGAAYNRNSHGTYPAPGTWQSVGPFLATEKMSGVGVPLVIGGSADSLVFSDPNFLLIKQSDIVLVPDWERVHDLMEESSRARAEWAWLVLPLRWGFPVSESPGATLMNHMDLGQVSPEGPAYQSTWNRLGYRTGWSEFKPQVLRVLMVPTTPWNLVRNGWGVLNAPLALIGLMPGWGVALTQALPWISGALNLVGSPPARTYYPGDPPFRFTSVGAGFSHSMGGARYARLLHDDSARQELRLSESDSGKVGTFDLSFAQRYQMNLFYGRKLSIENTLTFGDAILTYDDRTHGVGGAPRDSATLALRELTGGFRLNGWSTNDDIVQFYSRGGYGWTWYTLKDVSGRTADYEDKGGYATTLYPSRRWWPNTWYVGAGIELFTPKKMWILERSGLGARLDVSTSWHALGARRPGAENFGWVRRHEVAFSILTAW